MHKSAYGLGRVKTPDESIDASRPRRGAGSNDFPELGAFSAVSAPDADSSRFVRVGGEFIITLRLAYVRPVPVGRGTAPPRPDCPGDPFVRSPWTRCLTFYSFSEGRKDALRPTPMPKLLQC